MDAEKKKFDDIRKPLEQKGYQTLKSIGKGAFGEVVLVKNKLDEKLYAVKIIPRSHMKKKPYLQKYIDQEIQIMKNLDHPNIVKHQESFFTSDFIVIVMEYCEQGNLLTYQSRLPGRTFELKIAIRVIVEIMKGLKCIHEKNFIHRDIKSQNVLLKKIVTNSGYDIQYKIADFGFARSIGGKGAKTHCGTEKYMAPEIIANAYYGISVDLWALGILFYFMLFAEYPFKGINFLKSVGHDMKADINRKCTPFFNVRDVVSKKEKAKEINDSVYDFFKKIFVIDSKRRITFSNIIKHPLFEPYSHEFIENAHFYNNLEKNEEFVKDDGSKSPSMSFESEMEAEDGSRTFLLKKKEVKTEDKHLERELQEIHFEIRKIIYIKECALELYDNYASYLTYSERLGARYYLLKAFLFYAEPLLQSLQEKKMPACLSDANISQQAWQECIETEYYMKCINKLQEEQLKSQFTFEDTYSQIQEVIENMPIKNFGKAYTQMIGEKTFEDMKFPYRSTTSHIFRIITQNQAIDSHLRNKIKMRLFCCHMINRIFSRSEVTKNFPYFMDWLKRKNIHYTHHFDFIYFKKWILQQKQQNLEKNITLLHKTYF